MFFIVLKENVTGRFSFNTAMQSVLVTPGEIITTDSDLNPFFFYLFLIFHSLLSFISSHNVEVVDDKFISATLGKVSLIDKFLGVEPLKSRF